MVSVLSAHGRTSQALLGVTDFAGPSFVSSRLPSLSKRPAAALSAG